VRLHRVLLLLPSIISVLVLSCGDDNTTKPSDVTPPAQVTDLNVVSAGASSVTIGWTAPGDDGNTGTAKSYQIRWLDAPITSGNFGAANVASNPPAPTAAGSMQQFDVTGIDTMVVTYFALRATDEAGNTSKVSNNAIWTPSGVPQHFTQELACVRDNTIFEAVDSSNGMGAYMFAGKTNLGTSPPAAIRRALVKFDVAQAIPAGSTIDSVMLSLHLSRDFPASGERITSLHKVLADWGEGASNAVANEGAGATARYYDATWVYAFHDSIMWSTQGGDFDAAPHAQTLVGANYTFYTWQTAAMRADAQSWLDTPASNFGWIIIGDESATATAKRFDSRENPTAINRPKLTIYYTTP